MSDLNETIKLLKECDVGVQMGIDSIDDVVEDLPSGKLQNILSVSKDRHEQIQSRIQDYLREYGDEGKDPAMMASAMAKMKETMKMMTDHPECAAANVIIDGCSMGIKSIYKYYNQYPNAEKKVKDLVFEIVKEEEALSTKMRDYL